MIIEFQRTYGGLGINEFINVNNHIINAEPPWNSPKMKTLVIIYEV